MRSQSKNSNAIEVFTSITADDSFKSLHCSKTCKNLYLDESSSDVNFVFTSSDGTQQYLPAHKLLLANGSATFKAMFSGDYKEVDEVDIVDASCDEFKEFLQVFYLDELKITFQNAPGVMILADKYDVPECVVACDKYLRDHWTPQSVCLVFDLAIKFNLKELKQFCQDRVTCNAAAVFASEAFRQCSRDVLEQILKRGNLYCSAKEVFDGCMDWAEQASVRNGLDLSYENSKNQLAECFHLIPFHLMVTEEINECTTIHREMFDQDELAEMISIITLGPPCFSELKKFKPNTSFKTSDNRKKSKYGANHLWMSRCSPTGWSNGWSVIQGV